MRKIPLTLLLIIWMTVSCNIIHSTKNNAFPDHFLVTNDRFEVIWNRNDIHVMKNNKRPMIINAPGLIIVEGHLGNEIIPGIYALDISSGNLIWSISGVGEGDDIVTEDKILYRATSGNAEVKAYDLETGNILWSKLLSGGHSAMDLYTNDKKIFVYTNNNLFFILSSSGDILDTVHSTSRIFLEEDDRLFLQDGFLIKAINLPSKSELWRVEINNDIFHAPIFNDESIILDTLVPSSRVFSIDQSTGQINWIISEKTISNMFVMENVLYFLNSEGDFVGVDKNSGEDVLRISTTPKLELQRNLGEYYVTGDGTSDVIVIAFGDNHQIMAIKKLDP